MVQFHRLSDLSPATKKRCSEGSSHRFMYFGVIHARLTRKSSATASAGVNWITTGELLGRAVIRHHDNICSPVVGAFDNRPAVPRIKPLHARSVKVKPTHAKCACILDNSSH